MDPALLEQLPGLLPQFWVSPPPKIEEINIVILSAWQLLDGIFDGSTF